MKTGEITLEVPEDESRAAAFHGVAVMRGIRERLNGKLAGMSATELTEWLSTPRPLPGRKTTGLTPNGLDEFPSHSGTAGRII